MSERDERIDAVASTIARFESRCGICDQPIRDGDEIVCVEDEWCHAECGRER